MSAAPSLTTQTAECFAAFQGGDSQAMSDLVEALSPLLWRIARQQGLAATSAEDAVQTAWLRLVEHAATIEDPQAVLKWLVTTVKREAWRTAAAARRTDLSGGVEDVIADTASTEPGPAEQVVDAEASGVLHRHVAELPPRCRELLRVIAYAQKPDYATIAEALGMPVGSIGPTRGRCLAKLRAALVADPQWGALT